MMVQSVATLVLILVTGLFIPRPAGSQDAPLISQVEQLIGHLEDKLPEIRETIQDMEDAPESTWHGIGTKESYQDDLNDYLDAALFILLPKSYGKTREELEEIDDRLDQIDAEISKLEAGRIGQPPRPSDKPGFLPTEIPEILECWNPIRNIETRIRCKKEEATDQERKRDELIVGFRQLIKEQFGLELERAEIEALLYQVNGADLLDGIFVAKILTRVEGHIRNIIADTRVASLEVRLQYYEFAFVVRLIVERLHAKHLENYDTVYLAALAELERENQETLRENKSTLKKVIEDAGRRAIVEANIRVLGMARKAIVVYRDLLTKNRDKTNRMLVEAHKDALVARATLRTLEAVKDAEYVAKKALDEFTELSEVSAPDLLPLDDQELYNQFLDISKILSAKRTGAQ